MDLFDTLKREEEQDVSELKLPPKFVPTTYHDVEFELRWDNPSGTYDERLAALRKRGYDRHSRPSEVFTLLADSLEGKLSLEFNFVTKKITGWWWEWVNLAWERKGNLLIAYLDPEGLMWNEKMRKYVKKKFHYTSEHYFDITDKISKTWIALREFSDDFIEFHYGRKYDELPPQIKKEAYVWLPPDGVLWPVGRVSWYNVSGYLIIGGTFRGVKVKQAQNFIGNKGE